MKPKGSPLKRSIIFIQASQTKKKKREKAQITTIRSERGTSLQTLHPLKG